MTVPVGIDALRKRIAEIIGEDQEQLTDDDSLMDLGLDSMRAMSLLAEWRSAGLSFDTAQFLERPTIAAWAELLAEAGIRGS